MEHILKVILFILLPSCTVTGQSIENNHTEHLWGLGTIKDPKIWLIYLKFGLYNCVYFCRLSEIHLLGFKKKLHICILKKLSSAMDCSAPPLRSPFSYSQNIRVGNVGLEYSDRLQTVVVKKKKPFSGECINVDYDQHKINMVVKKNTVFGDTYHILQYSFETLKDFGLRFRFTEFLLSYMCIMKKIGSASYGTEYMIIQQNNNIKESFYFCMRRPQWTMFTNRDTTLVYFLCRFCRNLKSSIVFDYQVINGDSITTEKEAYYKITLRRHGKWHNTDLLLFNIICVNGAWFCSSTAFSYFIRGEKYHQIELWKVKNRNTDIYLLNFTQHAMYLAKIENYLLVNFHFCVLQVIMRNGS